MKNLLLAVSFLGLTTIVLVTFMEVGRGRKERSPTADLPDLLGPEETTVLAGTDGVLEILVKTRFAAPEVRDFADRALARSLGLDPRRFAFLEVLVLNRGDRPTMVDISDLRSRLATGKVVHASSLRGVVVETPARRDLLAAHAPRRTRPLEASSLRRGLVLVPADFDLDLVVSARLGGVPLSRCRSATAELDDFLARPHVPLLASVLGEDAVEELTAEGAGVERK